MGFSSKPVQPSTFSWSQAQSLPTTPAVAKAPSESLLVANNDSYANDSPMSPCSAHVDELIMTEAMANAHKRLVQNQRAREEFLFGRRLEQQQPQQSPREEKEQDVDNEEEEPDEGGRDDEGEEEESVNDDNRGLKVKILHMFITANLLV